MLNIIININESLLSQYNVEKVLKDSVFFIKLENINELQNNIELPSEDKRLVLYSIEELKSLNLLQFLKNLKIIQFKEIFEISTLNTLSIDALLKVVSYMREYKPNLGRKGRPSKILSLSMLQEQIITKWVQGNISLEECKTKTNLSQSTLYIIRKEKFQDYISSNKKNSLLLANVIREYHLRKIPLLKALRMTNISRPYFYRLASSFLESKSLIEYTSEDVKIFENLKGIESLTKVTPKNLKQNSKIIKFDFTNFIYRIYHVSSLNIKSCLVDGKKVKFSTFFHQLVQNIIFMNLISIFIMYLKNIYMIFFHQSFPILT